MVCGVLLSVVPKGQYEALMKLLCGLFLTAALMDSLSDITLINAAGEWIPEACGNAAAAVGENFSRQELYKRIKQKTEEYILDKAAAMNISISAEVTLSDTEYPIPVSVTIIGPPASSEQKLLEGIITEDLGISKENQLWMETRSVKE